NACTDASPAYEVKNESTTSIGVVTITLAVASWYPAACAIRGAEPRLLPLTWRKPNPVVLPARIVTLPTMPNFCAAAGAVLSLRPIWTVRFAATGTRVVTKIGYDSCDLPTRYVAESKPSARPVSAVARNVTEGGGPAKRPTSEAVMVSVP